MLIKPNHPYEWLVRKIADYRYANNCTNQTVADMAGLKRSKVVAFIAGTRVDKKTADKIAEAIGAEKEAR